MKQKSFQHRNTYPDILAQKTLLGSFILGIKTNILIWPAMILSQHTSPASSSSCPLAPVTFLFDLAQFLHTT